MPADLMDWVVIAGVVFSALAVIVAFMRRPKKTTNSIENGSRNKQTGSDGTTQNTIVGGNDNEQGG